MASAPVDYFGEFASAWIGVLCGLFWLKIGCVCVDGSWISRCISKLVCGRLHDEAKRMILKYLLPAGIVLALLAGAYYRGASDKETELTQQYQQAYIDQFEHHRQIEQDLQSKISNLDDKHMEDLLDAQANIDDVLSSIRTGERRLYVNTKPTNCTMSKNPTTASVDQPTGKAELDRDTAQRLIALTERGDQYAIRLNACLEYVQKIQSMQ